MNKNKNFNKIGQTFEIPDRECSCSDFSNIHKHKLKTVIIASAIYRVGPKSGPQTHGHNSAKSEPIKKLFSLEDSLVYL